MEIEKKNLIKLEELEKFKYNFYLNHKKNSYHLVIVDEVTVLRVKLSFKKYKLTNKSTLTA